MATNTKVVNGVTLYQIGDTWGKVDRSAPNQAQTTQMQTQLQQNGTVSDGYKQQFGMAPTPTYNYYTPPSTNPTEANKWLNSGGLQQAAGSNSVSATKTNDGRYLDTTNMTAQQANAASLWDDVAAGKRTSDSAMSVLAGMGLDKYGNQAMPNGYSYSPIPAASTSTTKGSIPGAITASANGTATNQNYGISASAAKAGTTAGVIPQAITTQNAATGGNPSQYGSLTSGLSASQKSAQDYITNSGKWGTLNDYVNNNINRFISGEISYDRLAADANRVGYAIPNMKSDETPTGSIPMAFTPTDEAPQIPIPTTPTIPVMDMNAIQAYVNGQLAAELTRQRSAADQAIAAGKNTANQQLQGLQTSYDRLQTDIGEQRGIENVDNARRLNPFSGRSDYALGMIERERGRTDREIAENKQTQDANVAANLAQLENEINAKYTALQQTQGAERERMIQEIKNDERAYESMLRGDLRADYLANSQLRNTDFNQDLSTWQANRGAYEFDTTFGYQKQQDQIQNDAQYGGTYNGKPTATQAQQTWENIFQQAQFDWQKAQQAWENAFNTKTFEQDMKEAAAARGLDWASLSQRQKEFVADQAYREKQFKLEQAKLNYEQNKPANYSYKTDPDFADDVAWINGNQNTAQSTIQSKSAELIGKYGYDGYQELLKLASGG